MYVWLNWHFNILYTEASGRYMWWAKRRRLSFLRSRRKLSCESLQNNARYRLPRCCNALVTTHCYGRDGWIDSMKLSLGLDLIARQCYLQERLIQWACTDLQRGHVRVANLRSCVLTVRKKRSSTQYVIWYPTECSSTMKIMNDTPINNKDPNKLPLISRPR